MENPWKLQDTTERDHAVLCALESKAQWHRRMSHEGRKTALSTNYVGRKGESAAISGLSNARSMIKKNKLARKMADWPCNEAYTWRTKKPHGFRNMAASHLSPAPKEIINPLSTHPFKLPTTSPSQGS